MATITVTLEDKSIIDAFNRLQRASRNMTPAMRVIAGILHDRAEQNFAEQRGPDGNEWEKLKPVRNKRRKNPKILIDTGRLKNSIAMQAGADFARIGTNIAYAAIHQFGGTIQRVAYSSLSALAMKKRKRVGKGEVAAHAINIPARPYMPFLGTKLQAGVEDEILETLRRHLGGALDGS